MNLAAFEAFIKVMKLGSISIAAEQLFITQPAVTKKQFIRLKNILVSNYLNQGVVFSRPMQHIPFYPK